jgi:hypothetical protein
MTGWAKHDIEDMPLEEFFDALADAQAMLKALHCARRF